MRKEAETLQNSILGPRVKQGLGRQAGKAGIKLQTQRLENFKTNRMGIKVKLCRSVQPSEQ